MQASALSGSFSFKREPRTAAEEGGFQPSSDLSVWGNLKAGFKEGWNQGLIDGESTAAAGSNSASTPASISDSASEVSYVQDKTKTVASNQSELLRSKGLGSRWGEAERIQKDVMYYIRKPVLVRGEFSGKVDKMVKEGRCPKIVGTMVEKLDNWPPAGKESFWIWGTENERYNEWVLKHDAAFASEHYVGSPTLTIQVPTIRCCSCCHRFLIADHGVKSVITKLSDLITSAERCIMCSLVLRSSIDAVNGEGNIELYRTWEALRAGSGGRRLLRFSADPVLDRAVNKNHRIPIGRPISPDDRNARFRLLNAWLRQCDHSHPCLQRRSTSFFPTRVLDVGGLEDMDFAPGWIRLISATERQTHDYIALSHRWGDLSAAQKMFCTSQSNLVARRKAFHVSEIPKTFQDAVKVVRAMGLRYLWIDSLCIIQSGDNGTDWNREVAQMQDVFSQAYCVIAATAASNSYSGFLDHHVDRVESVRITGGTDKQFYVSTDIDDYDRDVSNAAINTRAWVMQEAVLARRTIHFTSNQMYWECGKGVYCENLTRLKSHPRGKWFTMDPEFPIRLLQQPYNDAVLDCLTWLFEDYSKRNVTKVEDRPIAISGLEIRISEVLLCNSRFCTPERFLHRTLLWTPADKGDRIRYASAIPSWSWLSFSTGVIFEKAENFAFQLNTRLSFNPERKDALDADLAAFVGCTLEVEHGHCILRDDLRMNKGVLRFDAGDKEDFDSLHCVVVAKVTEGDMLDRISRLAMQPVPKRPCGSVSGLRRVEEGAEPWLVLLVVPTGAANEYRRVGIGSISEDCLVKVQERVQIV